MTNAATVVDREQAMLDVVKQYFIRADAARPDVLDLFTDDAELYFPKFGITKGKAGFGELATGLLGSLKAIAHQFRTSTTPWERTRLWWKARRMGRIARARNGTGERQRAEGSAAYSSLGVR
jgi:hypothetical protein